MAQHGQCERLDVFGGDVGATVEQGAGLAAEDEVLHGAGASTPAEPLLNELRSARFPNARLPHQGQAVMDDVIGDGHLANQMLDLENLFAVEHGRDLVRSDARGAASDLELFLEARVLHEHLEHKAVLLGFR